MGLLEKTPDPFYYPFFDFPCAVSAVAVRVGIRGVYINHRCLIGGCAGVSSPMSRPAQHRDQTKLALFPYN